MLMYDIRCIDVRYILSQGPSKGDAAYLQVVKSYEISKGYAPKDILHLTS